MKRFMYVLAMLAVGFVSQSFAQSPIDGKWKGSMETPNGAMEMTFNFKAAADSVSGTVESPMGALPISNGKLEGNKLKFEVSFNEMTMHHECTVMGDSLSLTLPDMPDAAAIILKKAKEEAK